MDREKCVIPLDGNPHNMGPGWPVCDFSTTSRYLWEDVFPLGYEL